MFADSIPTRAKNKDRHSGHLALREGRPSGGEVACLNRVMGTVVDRGAGRLRDDSRGNLMFSFHATRVNSRADFQT